jgi:hypothetical protein
MAGLVPATQTRGHWRMDLGGAEPCPAKSVRMGGRDKPGHDDQIIELSPYAALALRRGLRSEVSTRGVAAWDSRSAVTIWSAGIGRANQ